MLTEDFKERLRKHIEEDFDSSMEDNDEIPDGIGDSLSAGVDDFTQEVNNNFPEDTDEYLDFLEELIEEVIDNWEPEEDEDE